MTKEDFLSLPPSVALRVLFDAIDDDTAKAIEGMPKPKLPLPPKYDHTIYRQGGVQFASETDLSGLRWWHKKYSESAAGGGQYAANDKKNAESLARWIAWRECYPETIWSGERNREAVIAAPPSTKPAVYARDRSSGSNGARKPAAPPSEDINVDDDIPF